MNLELIHRAVLKKLRFEKKVKKILSFCPKNSTESYTKSTTIRNFEAIKVVLATQSVPKVMEIWINSIYTISEPIDSMSSTFSCKIVVKITCRLFFTAFYEFFMSEFPYYLKDFYATFGYDCMYFKFKKKNQLFYKTYLVLFNQCTS